MRARPQLRLSLVILAIVSAVIGSACVFGGEGDPDLSEFFPDAPLADRAEQAEATTSPTAPSDTVVVTALAERLLDVTIPPETALESVQKYYAFIAAGRFDDAYRLLGLDARDRISIEEFVTRHTDIWAEATITGLRWEVVPPPGENVAGIEVDLVYETQFFGEIPERVFARTQRQPNWVLDWTPDLIFDGLGTPGYLVHAFLDVPVRGDIFDRNGEPLAVKDDQAIIGISHDLVEDEELVIQTFVDTLSLDELAVRDLVFQDVPSFFFIPIVRLDHNTDPELIAQFEQMAELGILVRRELIRRYPQGELASHVVGFMTEVDAEELAELAPLGFQPGDEIGRDGAEAVFEIALAGERGGRLTIIAPNGQAVREIAERPLTPAQNVYLTIDVRVQQVAELALGDQAGAVIVLDPRTNQLLASASFPRFDPNDFVGGISQEDLDGYLEDERRPFVNRGTEETYAPGSTFKVVTAAAALEALGYTEETFLPCDAVWTGLGPDLPLRNWKEADAGQLNVTQAIAESCNTFFYQVGMDLHLQDENLLTEYSSGFGFGRETGVVGLSELPGINPGPEWKRLNRNDFWFTGDTVNVSIGQGFLDVTPLQIANAYSALATDGILRTPLAVASLRTSEGEIVQQFEATPIGVLPISSESHAVLQRATREVISTVRGTGWSIFRTSGVRAAGKSGTAEEIVRLQTDDDEEEPAVEPQATDESTNDAAEAAPEEEEDDGTRNHAWFVAYADVPSPSLLVTVVVDDGDSGATVAGPIARNVLERTMLSGWVPVLN
jgi:penicillin-binding protein 2